MPCLETRGFCSAELLLRMLTTHGGNSLLATRSSVPHPHKVVRFQPQSHGEAKLKHNVDAAEDLHLFLDAAHCLTAFGHDQPGEPAVRFPRRALPNAASEERSWSAAKLHCVIIHEGLTSATESQQTPVP